MTITFFSDVHGNLVGYVPLPNEYAAMLRQAY